MLDNNFEGFTLELRNSNFKELTGFEREIIRESAFGTKAPNITNNIDTLYIHCDLISNSVVDGRYSIHNIYSEYGSSYKKGKRKVQGVPQSQTTAPPRPQEEEETDKSKKAQIEQTYEKH